MIATGCSLHATWSTLYGIAVWFSCINSALGIISDFIEPSYSLVFMAKTIQTKDFKTEKLSARSLLQVRSADCHNKTALKHRLDILWMNSRTTDAQRGNSLHCTAENSIPIPNFYVRLKHILSATPA